MLLCVVDPAEWNWDGAVGTEPIFTLLTVWKNNLILSPSEVLQKVSVKVSCKGQMLIFLDIELLKGQIWSLLSELENRGGGGD